MNAAVETKSVNKTVPRIVSNEGEIFGGVRCYVLDDGRRVIAKRSLAGLLQPGHGVGAKRNDFERSIERLPNGSELLQSAPIIEARKRDGSLVHTYDASLAVKFMRLFLDAWKSGALRKTQEPVAQRAMGFLAILADVGITALIDEATGYQRNRPDDDLRRRLAGMIREERDDIDPVYKPLLIALDAPGMGGAGYAGHGNPPAWSPWAANVCVTCVWGEEGRARLRRLNPIPTLSHRDTQHFNKEGKVALIRAISMGEAFAMAVSAEGVSDGKTKRRRWEEMMRAYFEGAALQMTFW